MDFIDFVQFSEVFRNVCLGFSLISHTCIKVHNYFKKLHK